MTQAEELILSFLEEAKELDGVKPGAHCAGYRSVQEIATGTSLSDGTVRRRAYGLYMDTVYLGMMKRGKRTFYRYRHHGKR